MIEKIDKVIDAVCERVLDSNNVETIKALAALIEARAKLNLTISNYNSAPSVTVKDDKLHTQVAYNRASSVIRR